MLDRGDRFLRLVGGGIDVAQQAQRERGILFEQVGDFPGFAIGTQLGDQGGDAQGVRAGLMFAPLFPAGDKSAMKQGRAHLVRKAEIFQRRQITHEPARRAALLELQLAQAGAVIGIERRCLQGDEFRQRQGSAVFLNDQWIGQADAEAVSLALAQGRQQGFGCEATRIG